MLCVPHPQSPPTSWRSLGAQEAFIVIANGHFGSAVDNTSKARFRGDGNHLLLQASPTWAPVPPRGPRHARAVRIVPSFAGSARRARPPRCRSRPHSGWAAELLVAAFILPQISPDFRGDYAETKGPLAGPGVAPVTPRPEPSSGQSRSAGLLRRGSRPKFLHTWAMACS